ncbi:MAG: CAP domain-containing protein [Acutalibacteraceae bacterium]|nr:CAP domain-containing protein [Acutalibacteraceae bacterium]
MKRFIRTTAAVALSLFCAIGTGVTAHAVTHTITIPCPATQSCPDNQEAVTALQKQLSSLFDTDNASVPAWLNGLCHLSHTPLSPSTTQPTPSTDKPSADKPSTDKPSTDKPSTDKPSASVTNTSTYEQQVIDLINEIRVKNGLSPLTENTALSRCAKAKSQDMHDKRYFSHQSPTYGSPFDMMKQFGITYRTAGENIAMGQSTPQAVVNAWMNSKGHRANILNASFTQIGMGYVADGHYWTQQFIG